MPSSVSTPKSPSFPHSHAYMSQCALPTMFSCMIVWDWWVICPDSLHWSPHGNSGTLCRRTLQSPFSFCSSSDSWRSGRVSRSTEMKCHCGALPKRCSQVIHIGILVFKDASLPACCVGCNKSPISCRDGGRRRVPVCSWRTIINYPSRLLFKWVQYYARI